MCQSDQHTMDIQGPIELWTKRGKAVLQVLLLFLLESTQELDIGISFLQNLDLKLELENKGIFFKYAS